MARDPIDIVMSVGARQVCLNTRAAIAEPSEQQMNICMLFIRESFVLSFFYREKIVR